MLIRFFLSVVPPFRLDMTVWALKRREKNLVDLWDGQNYSRLFAFEEGLAKVQVKQEAETQIQVTVTSLHPIPHIKKKVTDYLVKMLSLKLDLKPFYEQAKSDACLYPLVEQFKGTKPPRFHSLFEAMVNAVVFQQLSLEAGMSILNRFAQRFGATLFENGHTLYAFPIPSLVMSTTEEALRSIGLSTQKSRALLEVASLLSQDTDDWFHLEEKSNEEIAKILSSCRCIRRWSIDYILLRGFGRLEILPMNDVAIQNGLQSLYRLSERPASQAIQQLKERFYPYGGLLYFHLLLDKLKKRASI